MHACTKRACRRACWHCLLSATQLSKLHVRRAQNMMGLLKQQYPSQLMPQLAARSQEALGAAAAAFPTARAVDPSGLQLFVSAVEARPRSPRS